MGWRGSALLSRALGALVMLVCRGCLLGARGCCGLGGSTSSTGSHGGPVFSIKARCTLSSGGRHHKLFLLLRGRPARCKRKNFHIKVVDTHHRCTCMVLVVLYTLFQHTHRFPGSWRGIGGRERNELLQGDQIEAVLVVHVDQ